MLDTPAPPPGLPPAPRRPGRPGRRDAGGGQRRPARAGSSCCPGRCCTRRASPGTPSCCTPCCSSYAWQRGSCFPGAERLQHDLGCGMNQVTRYLQELEGAGLVTRRRRGQGKTTLYTLHDPPARRRRLHHEQPANAQHLSRAPRSREPRFPKPGSPELPESGNLRNPETGSRIRLRGKRSSRTSSASGPSTTGPPGHRPTLAPTDPPAQEPAGAGDDDALLALDFAGSDPADRPGVGADAPHGGDRAAGGVAGATGRRPRARRGRWCRPSGTPGRRPRRGWRPRSTPPRWPARPRRRRQRQAEDEARRREWAAEAAGGADRRAPAVLAPGPAGEAPGAHGGGGRREAGGAAGRARGPTAAAAAG